MAVVTGFGACQAHVSSGTRKWEAAKYSGSMPVGLDNPLGARTLYLYQNGAYKLYTIDASRDAESIGSGITSSCVGLLTQGMMHRYYCV